MIKIYELLNQKKTPAPMEPKPPGSISTVNETTIKFTEEEVRDILRVYVSQNGLVADVETTGEPPKIQLYTLLGYPGNIKLTYRHQPKTSHAGDTIFTPRDKHAPKGGVSASVMWREDYGEKT